MTESFLKIRRTKICRSILTQVFLNRKSLNSVFFLAYGFLWMLLWMQKSACIFYLNLI